MWAEPSKPARIEPNRKWFGNVRTIDQKSLESFRVELAQQSNTGHQILLKKRKLPYSLLAEPEEKKGNSLLEFEKFEVFLNFDKRTLLDPNQREKE